METKERLSGPVCYLSHVDESQGQRLVAEDGSILVSLPSLQHDLKLVGVPLQEMWVLWVKIKTYMIKYI